LEEPTAAVFDTRPSGKPVRGDYQAQFDLERVALSVTAARNPALVGDGRLAAMALTLARSIDPAADFDVLKLAPLARKRGLVNRRMVRVCSPISRLSWGKVLFRPARR